ncbi:hypothetical protein DGG96_04045 [Legionella qingyii]|uniref:Protein IcmL (DotI) n=1 Tax=Legionella qingyii TaxID=2184757 RepID=A0A317U912_9GAMM|nr:hypothetical protein [Legionella qingyii]PWY56900.1 hypothetical protein DGG96_04045 [Legionella qingyii]RUR24458.1 hypothetical protein ELY20_05190 [Legionella qingyii]RUR27107.1 hypothetical protein ELY16_05965 [Legionella qingyii]
MNALLPRILLWLVLVISPFTLYAQNDAEICQWAKQILLNTLSVDYNYQASDDAELRKNYTANAWDALTNFLGNYLDVIRENHLTLHPKVIAEPYVAEKGFALGVHFWRINEVFSIPELNLTIAFSLIVIEANPQPSGSGRLLIQSIDMIKKENS